MKKLLNTLYITQPNSYISKDGMNVVVSIDQKEVFRIPILNLEGIVSFAYSGCSPGIMKLCVDNKVSLTFLTPQGKFISRIQGHPNGNVLVRRKQFLLCEKEEDSQEIANLIIASKIHNYRTILQRFSRDYASSENIKDAINKLLHSQKNALVCTNKGMLRGVEGLAASVYFSVLPELLTQQKTGFSFNGRSKRPPKDPVNAMLSFTYTILGSEIASALECAGLDPYVGVFHTLRPGRISLALDLLEEFRAYLCDRFVLSLINRKQVGMQHFRYQGDQGIYMTDDCRRILLTAWQTRKKEQIIHPYINERIPIGLLPYVQALLLARKIRGEASHYVPFLIK